MHIKDKNHTSSSTNHDPSPKTDKCFNYLCLLALPTAAGEGEEREKRQRKRRQYYYKFVFPFLAGSSSDENFSSKDKKKH